MTSKSTHFCWHSCNQKPTMAPLSVGRLCKLHIQKDEKPKSPQISYSQVYVLPEDTYLFFQLHHLRLGIAQCLVSDFNVSPLVFIGRASSSKLCFQLLLLPLAFFICEDMEYQYCLPEAGSKP